MRFTALTFLLALLPMPALAYIGPGVGLGAIGALVAVVVALLLIVAGFVWFPIKRALKRRRAARTEARADLAADTRASGQEA